MSNSLHLVDELDELDESDYKTVVIPKEEESVFKNEQFDIFMKCVRIMINDDGKVYYTIYTGPSILLTETEKKILIDMFIKHVSSIYEFERNFKSIRYNNERWYRIPNMYGKFERATIMTIIRNICTI